MSAPGFTRRGTEARYDGFFVRLVEASIEVPDGSVVTREIVVHPGAVAVVAVDADGAVVMERQYRAALDENVLEIPAGKLDVPGEDPQAAARRELIEETGYDARSWARLGAFYNSPGFTDEHTTLFLATDLVEVGSHRQGVEEETMELVRLPLDSAWELIASGELVDAKSQLGLLLALRHLAG